MGTAHQPSPATSRLRELSRQLVLSELSSSQGLSRSQLAARTGLSRGTVAAVVMELMQQGDITYGDLLHGRGRPARALSLAPSGEHVGAIDLGHTHVSVAIADMEGRILTEKSQVIDVDASATAAMDLASELLQECRRTAAVDSLAAIGAGIPGPVERQSGTVRSGTVLRHWTGIHPHAELAERFGSTPLNVENDAHLAALGEHTFGVARGMQNVLFVKVASGIGAGTILRGRLYRGTHGTAGEIGHVQVREDGVLCRCGGRGCLETVASTRYALQALREIHGPELTVDGVRELIEANDPGALRLAHDMGTAIGRVLAVVASHLDPEIVVISGPLVMDPGPLIDGVASAILHRTQPYVGQRTDVVGSILGDRIGVLGAVAVALRLAQAAR